MLIMKLTALEFFDTSLLPISTKFETVSQPLASANFQSHECGLTVTSTDIHVQVSLLK